MYFNIVSTEHPLNAIKIPSSWVYWKIPSVKIRLNAFTLIEKTAVIVICFLNHTHVSKNYLFLWEGEKKKNYINRARIFIVRPLQRCLSQQMIIDDDILLYIMFLSQYRPTQNLRFRPIDVAFYDRVSDLLRYINNTYDLTVI